MKIQDQIVAAIKNEKVIAKHIDHHHWISGSSTVVYPIALWHERVCIQMDTDHNYFEKAIKRVLDKNKDFFKNGWFWKSDGSCPSELTLIYTPETAEGLKNEAKNK